MNISQADWKFVISLAKYLRHKEPRAWSEAVAHALSCSPPDNPDLLEAKDEDPALPLMEGRLE